MRIALAVTAALALLAGCSSTDDDAASNAPSTSAASTTTTTAVRASAGCDGPARQLRAGEEKVTISSGGAERWFWRHVPPAHDGTRPLPLVVDLHGYLEGADVHVKHSALGPFGDRAGFVTVSPHGTGDPVRWDASLGSSDVAFMEDLLDRVEADACIDTGRVYATGLSYGAFMTSVLACDLADRFAAVAPVAGVTAVAGCEPSRPVPVVAFHGTDDKLVTYDGEVGDAIKQLPAPDGSGRKIGDLIGDDAERLRRTPVPEMVEQWARRNSCEGAARETKVAGDVTKVAYDCPAGAEVELYRVEGGGHSWPGSEFSKAIEQFVGHTTTSISANEVMWRFFQDHPLPPGS